MRRVFLFFAFDQLPGSAVYTPEGWLVVEQSLNQTRVIGFRLAAVHVATLVDDSSFVHHLKDLRHADPSSMYVKKCKVCWIVCLLLADLNTYLVRVGKLLVFETHLRLMLQPKVLKPTELRWLKKVQLPEGWSRLA